VSANIFTGPHTHLSIDRLLLRRLGLKPCALPHGAETLIGTVKFPRTRVSRAVSVKIFCTALPAMFWKFEFYLCGQFVDQMETGSGSLTTFWPKVLRQVETWKGAGRE
jgi:hypothetical protein